ncbi:hypothetical protein [Pseudomonas sp.]|uniref:hypothetical protein n=1 Tax=Pseudomonas sp. TaxID=306 RepID=UPI003CC69889
MSEPYAYINDTLQTYPTLKAKLGIGDRADDKFDQLNAHIRNIVVMPGQLVLVPDNSTRLCTAQEAWLMSQANVVKHALMASGVSGDGFMLRNYDLLQSMLGHSALGAGAATGGWSKHLTEVQQTLEKIEALHKSHLAHGGHGARNDFLAKRAELFKTLEAQLKGMGRYGSGLRTNTSIKKMLKISTRSYQHQGEIKQYAAKVRNVARVAKQLKMGNYVGWALSTASSLLEIEEACSTGTEEQCRNAKFVEGAKLVTSIFLSTAAGGLGAVGGKAVCAAIGIPSAGTGLAICVIVGGSVGGFAGGELGNSGGEYLGNILYEALEK